MTNIIILGGRLTADPELKTTSNDKTFCRFTLANDHGFGEKKKTSFVDCVAFGKLAETIKNYKNKGSALLVSGFIQQDTYEGKTGLEVLFGIESGLNQITSGIEGVVGLVAGDDYIAPSVTAQTTSLIREDLSDEGLEIFGNSLAQVAFDTISTTVNMIPSMAISAATGVGGLGTAFLGMTAAGNEYQKLINSGMNTKDAAKLSTILGVWEGASEAALGSLEGMGKGLLAKPVKKALEKVSAGWLRAILDFGVDVVNEGLEEVIQGIGSNLITGAMTGQYEKINGAELAYEFTLGALTAFFLNGAGKVNETIQYRSTASDIKGAGNVEELANAVKNTFAADTIAYKLAGNINENSKVGKIAKLLREVDGSISEQNETDISNNLISKGVSESDAKTITKWFSKALNGGYLTKGQINILDSNPLVATAFKESIIDANSTVNQRLTAIAQAIGNTDYVSGVDLNAIKENSTKNVNERIQMAKYLDENGNLDANKLAMDMAIKKSGYVNTKIDSENKMFANEIEENISKNIYKPTPYSNGYTGEISAGNVAKTIARKTIESGIQEDVSKVSEKVQEAVSENGEFAYDDFAKVESVVPGKSATIKLKNGTTISNDAFIPRSTDTGVIIENGIRNGYTAGNINAIVNLRNANTNLSLDEWLTGINETIDYGKQNYELNKITDRGFSGKLTESERMFAYNIGREISEAETESKTKAVSKKTKNKTTGKVAMLESAKETKLDEARQAQIDYIGNLVSEITSGDVYYYASKVVDGRRILTETIDKNNRAGMPAPNGIYKNGAIYLDINAGVNGNGVIMWTFAHELTHFISEWSPAKYKVLADFLMENYSKKGVDIIELVAEKKRIAKANGHTLSTTAAYEEIVADSMQTMFTDTNLAEKLIALKNKDASLFNKIKAKFNELYAKFKAFFTGRDVETIESKYVRELGDGLETLRDAFAAAIVDAGKIFANAKTISDNKTKLIPVEEKSTAENFDARYGDISEVDLSNEDELRKLTGDLTGSEKYKIIQSYILSKLGDSVTFPDGLVAKVDRSDAIHIANKSADKKTAEISAIDKLIKKAFLYAEDDNVEHNKFSRFIYYEVIVKYRNETYPIYFNIGWAKNGDGYHIYDITHKIRDTAHRFNDVERLREFRSANSISTNDDTTSSDVSQEAKNETSSEEEKILTEQQELLLPEPPVSVSSPDVEGNVETVETATKSEVESVVKTDETIKKAQENTKKSKAEAKKRTQKQRAEETQAKKEAETNRIEDFGNKIGGAKKDNWKSRGLFSYDITEMNDAEREKYVEKNNVWKKPDYDKMIENGTPVEVVWMIKRIRDMLPTAPQKSIAGTAIEDFANFIDYVRIIQSAAESCATREDVSKLFEKIYVDNGWYEKTESWDSYIGTNKFALTEKGRSNRQVIATSDIAQMLKKFASPSVSINMWNWELHDIKKKQFGVPKDQKLPAGVSIHMVEKGDYGDATIGTFYVTKGYYIIGKDFATREEALEFVRNKFAKKTGSGKTKFMPEQLKEIHRKGRNIRNNNTKHIDGNDYLSEFGFYGGEFGNWVTQTERAISLDYGYDSFNDLAEALGITNEDISLGRKLSIAFGSRGEGSALAHYEPLRNVINLTRMKGAGSLAHEWGHALDYFLGKGSNLTDRKNTGIPALDKIIKDMNSRAMTEAERDELKEKTIAKNKKRAESTQKALRSNLESKLNYAIKQIGEGTAQARTLREKAMKIIDKIIEGKGDIPSMYWYESNNGDVFDLSMMFKEAGARVIPKETRIELQSYISRMNKDINDGVNISEDMTTDSDFLKGSKFFDNAHSKTDNGYWSSTAEMFARAFACYVNDTLKEKGFFNDYLCGHAEKYWSMTPEGEVVAAIPVGEERKTLKADFDALFEYLRNNGTFTARGKETTEETFKYSDRDTEYLELAKDPEKNEARLSEMVEEKAKSVANSKEVSDALYTVNKIAKSYGYKGSQVSYRSYDPELQNRLYQLKDNLIKKYGKYETTHRFARGYGELYSLGEHSFHLFNNTSRYFEDLFDTFFNDKTNFVSEKKHSNGLGVYDTFDGRLITSLPVSENAFEYFGDENKVDKINERYASYMSLEKVEPPRDTETEITKEQEEKAIKIVENFANKLSDPVTYDDNGNVIPLSERFNSENDDIRYSDRDSEGNMLTEAQKEYFKDSKVRDENGNLLVVYHGTDADFTVFDRTKGRSTADIQGMFFSPWELDSKGYGSKVSAYYLNITNPASESLGYKALNMFKGQNDAGIKAREYLESLGYDGVNNGNEEYIAFYPEQIKKIDNENPTDSEDVRYSDRESLADAAKKMATISDEDYLKAKNEHPFVLVMENTPKIITDAINRINKGIGQDRKILIKRDALYLAVRSSGVQEGNYHNLGSTVLANLPKYIQSPDAILTSDYSNRRVMAIASIPTSKGNAIISIEFESPKIYESEVGTFNIVVTVMPLQERYLRTLKNKYNAVVEYQKENLEQVNPQLHKSLGIFNSRFVDNDNTLSDTARQEEFSETEVNEDKSSYSERDPDISNRTLLTNALQGTITNADEKAYLLRYQEQIAKLDKMQAELDSVRKQIKDISFSKGTDRTKLPALRDKAERLSNSINAQDKKLLNLEANKSLKAVLNREKAKAYELARIQNKNDIKAEREKALSKQQALSEKYRNRISKGVESRSKTRIKNSIKGIVNDIDRLLNRGTKEKNVKAGMKDAVAQALDTAKVLFSTLNTDKEILINGVTTATPAEQKLIADYTALVNDSDSMALQVEQNPESTDNEGLIALMEKNSVKMRKIELKLSDLITREKIRIQSETVGNAIQSLANVYRNLSTSETNYINWSYDPTVYDKLIALKDELGGATVEDMTEGQLLKVKDAYKLIKHTITSANKIFRQGKAEDVAETAENLTSEVLRNRNTSDSRSVIRSSLESFVWNELKPGEAFKMLNSDTALKLYHDFEIAEDTWARDVAEARSFKQEIEDKYNYDKWDFKKAYKIKLQSGQEIELNLEKLLSIYAYSKREQALGHMEKGGFVLKDAFKKMKANGKKSLMTYLPTSVRAYKMTDVDIANVIKTIGSEKVGYVDDMQKYLSSAMGAKGNEASNILYGIDLFKENVYFPLKSSKDFIFSANEPVGEVSLKNSGMTKETVPNASNPIVLEDFDEIWANHVGKMSTYHSFVVPIENFNKVFNYTNYLSSDDSSSVKTTLKSAFGNSSVDYLQKLIQDLNGGVTGDRVNSPFIKLFSKFKKTAVGASASVVIQQPTAILRAMAMIDPKYFIADASIGHKAKWEQLKKYAPIAVIKEIGGFDAGAGAGRSAARYLNQTTNLIGKIDDVAMRPAGFADEIGWNLIWDACKREIRATEDLEGEELLVKAGERFSEVVRATQVYDSTLSRSGYMRSKNDIAKMATAFMGEPTTSFNMLLESVVGAKEGRLSKAEAVRTVSFVAIASLAACILKSFVGAARKDDDDEAYLNKYAKVLATNVLDEMFIPNMLPFVRDVVTIMQGWNVERTDMSLIQDLYDGFDSLFNDNKTVYRKIEDFGGAIANAFGIPVRNIMRDGRALYNVIKAIFDDTTPKHVARDFAEGMWSDVLATFSLGQAEYDTSLNAFLDRGDTERAMEIINDTYEKKMRNGKTKKEVKTSIQSSLTSYWKPKFLEAYRNKDNAEMSRIRKLLNSTKIYDDVVDTTQGWIKSLNK